MIDINKKYSFKGVEGTVLSIDRKHKDYPVVWMSDEGVVYYFTSDGNYSHGRKLDHLIEVHPTQWLNVYEHYAVIHPSKEKAEEIALKDIRIACLEFKKGDGI